MAEIIVKGACENNLKNISLKLPKNNLCVFTGCSGSGKSSLVFDTVYVESFRRFLDASHVPTYFLGSHLTRSKRPQVDAVKNVPPALGLSQRQAVASLLSTVGTISSLTDLLRVYFAAFGQVFCKNCKIPLKSISFQSILKDLLERYKDLRKVSIVANIAEKRKGSFAHEIEKMRKLGFSKLIVNQKTSSLQSSGAKISIDPKKLNTIDVIVDSFSISEGKKSRLERALEQALEFGHGVVKIIDGDEERKYNTKSSCPQCGESAIKLDPRFFSHSSLGKCRACEGTGASDLESLNSDIFPCHSCHGSRLSSDRPLVTVCDKTFEDIQKMTLKDLHVFFKDVLSKDALHEKSKQKIYQEAQRLSDFIVELGLGHLMLNRSGQSLAPGDLQRLRLASMISNQLTGALYILDEPCQGLTRDEVKRLLFVLRSLVDRGSSVLCVEHHPEFLKACDYLFVMGPGAGEKGGRIIWQGHQNEYKTYLKSHNEDSPSLCKPNLKKRMTLGFQNVEIRNLKLKKLEIKSESINLIRGPSGGGKATFVDLCLLPALEELLKNKKKNINLDFCQAKADDDLIVKSFYDIRPGSLKKSSKRPVASALDVLVYLRELFASLPLSQMHGLTQSHFSWNSKIGQCSHCGGKGEIEHPQKYGITSVRTLCEYCLGSKLQETSLLPRFKDYNFAEVLDLSIQEACEVFRNQPRILRRLEHAEKFGLGYIKLGQTMDALSGGEIQRLILTLELRRSNLKGTFYILRHPSTGLHARDIFNLLEVLRQMIAKGASFILIENREEFYNKDFHILTLDSK